MLIVGSGGAVSWPRGEQKLGRTPKSKDSTLAGRDGDQKPVRVLEPENPVPSMAP